MSDELWPDAPSECLVLDADPVLEFHKCGACGEVMCEQRTSGTFIFKRCKCPKAALYCALRDAVWKATAYGITEDGDTAAYIVPKGAMHRLVGAAQADGMPVALRRIDHGIEASRG